MKTYFGMLKTLALFTGMTALTSFQTEARVWYVAPDGTGTAANRWNNATDLQYALSNASSGDDIWLLEGVYYPDEGTGQTNNNVNSTFVIPHGVSLYGGFSLNIDDVNERDPALHRTILSGDLTQDDIDPDGDGIIADTGDLVTAPTRNANHVLTFIATGLNTTPIIFDGLIITAGDARNGDGGAMYIRTQFSTITFEGCYFSGNRADTGGALFMTPGLSGNIPVVLNRCVFKGNSANGSGGAIATSVRCLVSNSVFSGNAANTYGGAVTCNVNPSAFASCTFSGNRAGTDGGAIFLNSSNSTFSDTVVWNNQEGSSTTSNSASLFTAGNVIPSYIHCLFQNINLTNQGSGNFNGDSASNNPDFLEAVDPVSAPTGEGDLRLADNSPLIDAGTASPDVGSEDVNGFSRIMRTAIDVGAHEAGWRLYVDDSAASGGDGSSWNAAFDKLQDALAAVAEGDPADIWVAEGVYYPDEGNGQTNNDRDATFRIHDSISLYGGFEGTETVRDGRAPEYFPTVLSGDLTKNDTQTDGITLNWNDQNGNNAYNVVTIIDANQHGVVLSGFTLTGGRASLSGDDIKNNGGGLYCADSTVNLSQTSFYGNRANHQGGALFAKDSHITLDHAVVSGNQAGISDGDGDGGGFYLDASGVSFADVEFLENEAARYAGALMRYAPTDAVTLSNVRFSANRAENSGGAVVEVGFGHSDPNGFFTRYYNCLFSGNSSYGSGGAGRFDNIGARFVNCTVVGNLSDINGAGGIAGSPSIDLYACIFWGNGGNGNDSGQSFSVNASHWEDIHVEWSVIEGIDLTSDVYSNDANGNLDGTDPANAPLFADPLLPTQAPTTGGSYQLLLDSLYIDRGLSLDSNTNPTTTDLAGRDRAQGSKMDVGAYEHDNSLVPVEDAPEVMGAYIGTPRSDSIDLTEIFDVDSEDIEDLVIRSVSAPGLVDFTIEEVTRLIVHGSSTTSVTVPSGIVDFTTTGIEGTAVVEFLLFTNTGVGLYTVEFKIVPEIIYVDATANGNRDGTSWTHAFKFLRNALAAAVPDTTQKIWVATGTYYPDDGDNAASDNVTMDFKLVNGVTIYGGFPNDGSATDLSDRDIELYPSVLSGDIHQDDAGGPPGDNNSWDVIVTSQLKPTAVLDGFTITRGNTAINNFGGEPTIRNCTITLNLEQRVDDRGGAVRNADDGHPTFENCTFSFNEGNDGGAIYNLEDASLTVNNCFFIQNKSGSEGGAIANHSSGQTLVTNSTFIANESHQEGGAVDEKSGANSTYINCVFSGNYARFRGGAMATFHGSETTLTSCTFGGNRGAGGGAIGMEGGTLHLNNTLIWNNWGGNNGTHGIRLDQGNETVIARHSLVETYSQQDLIDLGGSNNLDGTNPANDPLFRVSINAVPQNPKTEGDFRVFSGSPVLDVGDDSLNALTTDVDANPRVQNGQIDIGAYEFDPSIVATQPSDPVLFPRGVEVIQTGAIDLSVFFSGNPSAYHLIDNSKTNFVTDVTIAANGSVDLTFANTNAPNMATLTFSATNDNGGGDFITVDVYVYQDVFYVNATVSGGNDNGRTWNNAYASLKDALDATIAGFPTQQVWVAEGVYYPGASGERELSFELKDGVEVYGGFSGGESALSERNPDIHVTVLSGDIDGNDTNTDGNYIAETYQDVSGDNAYTVVKPVQGATGVVLDGFTVTAGKADLGVVTSEEASGAGLYASDVDLVIRNCIFSGHSATASGSAIYVNACHLELENSRLLGCEGNHGIAYSDNTSTVDVENVLVAGNTSASRGIVTLHPDDRWTFVNCVFSGNDSGNGILYFHTPSFPCELTNVTFAGNSAVYLIDVKSGSLDAHLNNTVAWGNFVSTGNLAKDTQFIASHSLLEGIDLTGSGSGNLDGTVATNNPLFIQPVDPNASPTVEGDLRLSIVSPVLNAGSDLLNTTSFDLGGGARVQGSAIDLGAYEGGVDNLPVITLNDAGALVIEQHSAWSDPGAMATDYFGGALSIVIGGDTVDTSSVGTYVVTYDAVDAYGFAGVQLTRTVEVLSSFVVWSMDHGLMEGGNDGLLDDPELDGNSNLYEYAFGLNPLVSDPGALSLDGVDLSRRGAPHLYIETVDGQTRWHAFFLRRSDYDVVGLSYTVEFSSDLSHWETSGVAPTVRDADSDVELVSVQYPAMLSDQSVPRFFRIVIGGIE